MRDGQLSKMRRTLIACLVIALGFWCSSVSADPDHSSKAALDDQTSVIFARWKAAALAHDVDEVRTAIDDTKSLGDRVIPALVKMLNSSDNRLARIFAAQVLQQFGSAAAITRESLLRNLRDNDPEVVVASMQALTEVSEYWANGQVELLTQLVRDNVGLVRVHAIMVLGHAGPRARSAVPVLRDVLEKDASNNCRMWAAKTLSYIAPKDPMVIVGLIEFVEQRRNGVAMRALIRAGPSARPAVPSLIRILSEDSGPREEAAMLLGVIGPSAADAIPVLLKRLTDRDARVASRCALAVASVGIANPEVVTALLRCAEAGDHEVRSAAIHALGTLGPRAREAIPLLCALLQDRDSKLRGEAARSLGVIDSLGGQSESLLRQCLKESDEDTQRHSAIALALLGEETPQVLRLLSTSLARRDINALPALQRFPHGAQHFGPTLVKMAHDSNGSIRTYGVRAIGHLSNVPEEILKSVSERLTDEDHSVQIAAADALGRLGPMARSQLAALQRASADDYWLVQEAAERAIEKIR